MRAFKLVALGSLLLTACAPPGDGGTTGPGGGTSTAALVDFTATSVTLGGVQLQGEVSVLVRDARGVTIPTASVTWTSDNPGVVTVSGSSSTATLVSHSPGTARIRANAGTAASEITVRVLDIRTLAIQQAAVSVRTGDSQLLTYAIDAEPGALQTVRWSSDNAAVATVSAQGLVTGVSVGTATVRAAANGDPAVFATVPVTVTQARGVVVSPAITTLWVGDSVGSPGTELEFAL